MSQQSIEALKKANHVRSERNRIKREIKAGTVTVRDVLEADPYVCAAMSISELLTSQTRWGPFRVSRLLAWYPPHPISENREIRDLSPRQKQYIIDAT